MFALHEAIGIPQDNGSMENILTNFGIPLNKDRTMYYDTFATLENTQ